jgi:CelD/BcsL family acetyltransferase involved in cellulose biosynthesis
MSALTMRCEALTVDRFDRVASEWGLLASRYSSAPFMQPLFVGTALKHFASGSERIVIARDTAGVAAVGVFSRRRGLWETFQPSQSPIGALVLREGVSIESLLQAAGRCMPGPALGVAATQQDPLYCQRPQGNGGSVSALDYIKTASVEVSGRFEDYWNARGKNLRQNLRKQRRKLQDDGIDTSLEVISAPRDVGRGVAAYGALESAGWKASGGTAISPDNAQGRFYSDMLESFCARGRGKICLYRFGAQVVVVDLCIESDDALVVLKTTYDESIRAFSPAALMREELFQQWWQQGRLRRIEFYGPVMEWHLRWTDQVRTLFHVNWYRWPTLMRTASQLAQRWRPRAAAAHTTQEATG